MIRVFLVDDHSIVRQGLRAIIDSTSDMRCVGWGETKVEALQWLTKNVCDIVLLDHSLPDGNGVELMHTLQEQGFTAHIVFYTMLPDQGYALRLLRAGAAAFLSKTSSTEEILLAIRQVAQHGRYLTVLQQADLLRDHVDGKPAHTMLSEREYDIFLRLVAGSSPSEISTQLQLAPSTVSTHLRRIRNKLQLETVADMVHYAYQHRLLEGCQSHPPS